MMQIPPALILVSLAACVSLSLADPEPKEPTLKETKAHFEKADQALNAVWAEAKKVLPASEFNSLKEDQRAWIEHRDYLALSPMFSNCPHDEKEARQSPQYFESAAGLMEERTEWLKARIRKDDSESLTGEWGDSCGGCIEVVEKDGKLHFLIQVVRGPTSHLGALAGVAAWNTRIGWFSDKGRDPGKPEETNLAFVQRGRELEVIGANTGFYHGMRAYFDGKYIKVKPLDQKTQDKVLKAAKTGEVPEE